MSKNGIVTLDDVSKHSGVSAGSISRYLNNSPHVSKKMSKKIEQAMNELNYTPNVMAQRLARGRSNNILVYLLHENPAVSTTWLYEMPIIQSIDNYLRENGYTAQISLNSHLDIENNCRMIKTNITSKMIDGIIIISGWTDNHKIIHILQAEHFPFVMVGNRNDVSPNNEVLFDNKGAVSALIEKLYKKGHRQFGFFGGYFDQQHTIDRFQGFRETCEKLKLQVRNEWIKYGDYSMESGTGFYLEVRSLKEYPTAIICGNDSIAAGVVKGASLKPGNPKLEVTGFDDTVVARLFNPPITTVRVPAAQMGKTAVEALLEMISRNEFIFESKVLECEIIE